MNVLLNHYETEMFTSGAVFFSLMTANLAFYAANRQSPEPNPDYTWTVIQYPLNQEVIVDLSPGPTLATPYGRAKVTCTNGTTTIVLDLSNLPANTPALNLYAIDPFGKGMMLGLMAISNGVAQQTFTTPLDKFMLVLSPEAPAY